MDVLKLFKQLRDIAPRIKSLQNDMERELIQVECGEGQKKVRVTINGRGEVMHVTIMPDLLQEKALLEELIAQVMSEANEKAKQKVKHALKEIFGGVSIPGLEKII